MQQSRLLDRVIFNCFSLFSEADFTSIMQKNKFETFDFQEPDPSKVKKTKGVHCFPKLSTRKKNFLMVMDVLQVQTLISGILVLLVGALLYQLKKANGPNAKICAVPQAAGAWPIVGHLHHFGAHQLTHKTLGMMADKHGPIFTIKLGTNKVLVLSSWEMAKECFTVHDKAFSTRPCVAATKLMTYNSAMFGFAPHGPYWREMRKFATIELLSNQRLELLKDTRTSELEAAAREVYKLWSREGCPKGGVLVDMKRWFADLTHNIILRMVGGKPCYGASSDDCAEGEAGRYKKAMRDFMSLFGVFVLSDAIPFLGWLDNNGYKKAMKKTASEIDTLVEGWLEEHKRKREVSTDGTEEQDVMGVMLNVLHDLKVSGYDSDTIIKATCLVSVSILLYIIHSKGSSISKV